MNLIEQVEQEMGSRWDDEGPAGDWVVTTLFGALARAMGQSNHRASDDLVAGMVIRHQMSPEGRQEREGRELLSRMLTAGLSPDDCRVLMGWAGEARENKGPMPQNSKE